MNIGQRAERLYSRLECRADAMVHVLGIVFAINATAWLMSRIAGGAGVAVSVSVYCAGLLAMVLASAAYNLTPPGGVKAVLRRFDHAAIFILIAATYTPFAVNRLGEPTGLLVLAAIWLAATFGVSMKLLFPHRFERVSIALYLAMGWLIVLALKPLIASVATLDLWLLLGGGAVYSAGVAFYLIERIPFHRAIWHGFVLTAAILQFTAIAMEFVA